MPGRRLLAAAIVAIASIVGLTAILEHVHPATDLATALLLFLAVVVVAAVIGGVAAGITTAVVSVPVIVWFLVEPVHTFDADGRDAVSILVFLAVAIAVSVSIELVSRRSADARRARTESEHLAVAAEGDRLRTAILRAVSHDLRTPLASIKASATSLLQDDVDWSVAQRHEFLVTIDEETDRLDRIVGDLLDMSRLDAGVVRPELVAVDLDVAVRVAVAGLDADRVRVHTGTAVPEAAADQVMLERVIANLVSNGLRHGGDTVDVHLRHADATSTIEIVDHGPGMSADDVERAFEPFHRLGDRASGSGLGLAVARGFVDAMGGRLELVATPGGGLTAVIRLADATSPAGATNLAVTRGTTP